MRHIYTKGNYSALKRKESGAPTVSQGVKNLTVRMQVQSLVSLSGLRIQLAVSCGVGHRSDSDLPLLWLWCKPAALVPIGPLSEVP